MLRKRILLVTKIYKGLLLRASRLFGLEILKTISAGVAGVVLQVAAITLALYYGKLLSRDSIFSFGPYTTHPQSSISFLVIITISCLTLFILAALFSYYYQKKPIKLAALFERDCIDSLLLVMNKNKVDPDSKKYTPHLSKIILTDSRACGRALLMSVWSIVPLITTLISSIFLFWLHPILTISLIPVLGIYIYYLSNLNSLGARFNQKHENHGIKLRSLLRDLQTSDKFPTNGNGSEKHSTLYNSAQSQTIDDYLHSYSQLIGLSYRSYFYSDLLLGVAVSLVLFGLSATAILSHANWALVIGYLVALRYAIHSSKQGIARLTVAFRFLHQVKRFMAIVNAENNFKVVAATLFASEGVDHKKDSALDDNDMAMID